jgi:long-chain acyl-CoA synthetase
MIEWWGPVIWEAYAGAEGGGTLVGPKEWLRYPGTVGRAIPGSQLKILSDSGEELPPGEVGTIYMTRFTGDRFEYNGDRDKTLAAYRGEFFTLGDVGYLNDDGYLFICDRKVDMIISYGMNIYSAEVEQALLRHPKVVDCVVFGIPHELAGEIVVAAIRLEDAAAGTGEFSLELQKFLAEHLSLAKLPRRIVYTSESLREATGKPSKKRLRAQYATTFASPEIGDGL